MVEFTMGKRGPKKLPDAERKARGTFQKCRSAAAAPPPVPAIPGAPEMPPALDAVGRAEWARIVPLLAELKILGKTDTAVIEAYCRNYSLATYYQAVAEKKPMVKVPGYADKPNPAAAEARQHWKLANSCADRLGLSPAARSRLNAPAPTTEDEQEADPDEAFLFGGAPKRKLEALPGGKQGA